jgi:hypothetical protein
MSETQGCPITMWPNGINLRRTYQCCQPLAPGAKFCAKHEADRIRLSK